MTYPHCQQDVFLLVYILISMPTNWVRIIDMGRLTTFFTVGILSTAQTLAQSFSTCATTISASVPAPSVASGYEAALVATGLTNPRDMVFDTSGHLLVRSASRGSYDAVLNIFKGCATRHRRTGLDSQG